jgi:hypothetical protein
MIALEWLERPHQWPLAIFLLRLVFEVFMPKSNLARFPAALIWLNFPYLWHGEPDEVKRFHNLHIREDLSAATR